jgi:REP element-mobilizing transposase RayT
MFKNEPDKYLTQRRTRRLPGYDYSKPGSYSITIVTANHVCIFGDVVNEKMILNPLGEIVREEWLKSGKIRNEIELDSWVIMPNHIHGIVHIKDTYYSQNQEKSEHLIKNSMIVVRKPKSLSTFVSGFKSAVSRSVNKIHEKQCKSIWQYNYYDHIIRDEFDLNYRRNYILENPARWHKDKLNPANRLIGV